jgi:putative ABC transport system ATP-binding protein
VSTIANRSAGAAGSEDGMHEAVRREEARRGVPGTTARPKLGPLFSYIWRNSQREQLVILIFVIVSLPFYYMSLELPKSIVNDAIQGRAFKGGNETAPVLAFQLGLPSWLGGWSYTYPGVEFERIDYLFALSGLFMVLVLINGAFRYVINMQKGKLGERLLRRLRLDLFTLLLLFSPEAIRSVKPSEVATIIKDEVEPIGGFVGDAFVQPAFLGGQALTALAFILVQSPSLGFIAAVIVLMQGFIIPRMRREQLRLGRERQLRSRHLAGHIGEIVDGMAEVENHGTSFYERYKVARQLDQLFWIRYQLYGRKFMVKFINSVLAQITPFLFYSIGGYYALRGSLDIGQLVAVIAAYRDLPPPIKELIDWDQQRLDVAVKYQQIVEQFAIVRPEETVGSPLPRPLGGAIEVQGLRVRGTSGEMVLEGINTTISLGAHAALLGLGGEGADVLAQVIGRRISAYEGTVRIAGRDLSTLTEAIIGPRMAYFGRDAAIFQGTIRDNVLYSLRRPAVSAEAVAADLDRIVRPVSASPRSSDPLTAGEWTDFAAAGVAGPEDVDDAAIEALETVGMAEAIYRLGLGRRLDPKRESALANRFVEVRGALNRALDAEHAGSLIEPLDPERFNRNATLGENLLFGVLRATDADEGQLFRDSEILAVLDEEGLTDALADVGLAIAGTMVEIFADLSGDHFLFERFSFIAADELPEFTEIVARARNIGQPALSIAERARLMTLALAYVEPRHRLGLAKADLMERIVRARQTLRQKLPAALADAVEFYDPSHYCTAAPLRDNLLFGRIDQSVAGATERVLATLHHVLRAMGLEREIYRIGLEYQTGPGGRLLSPTQRSAVALARCLVKRPEILILDQPLAVFGEVEGRAILKRVRQRMASATLIAAMRDADTAATFDIVLSIAGGRLKAAAASHDAEAAAAEPTLPELEALRAVPMFATIDTARLKLIAFTSERMSYFAGQTMFRQGDPSDAAYVLLDGAADVFLETASDQLHLATIGAHSIVGEMGVVSGAGRSATVIAASDLTAIRLSKDVVLGLISEFPQIALAMLRDQIHRIVAADARLAKASGLAPRSMGGAES